MRRFRLATCCLILGSLTSRLRSLRSRAHHRAPCVRRARLIVGDETLPSRWRVPRPERPDYRRGKKGAVPSPPGVTRVDLTGKTVMPAMVNAHAHLG
jgi:hypothetical protein